MPDDGNVGGPYQINRQFASAALEYERVYDRYSTRRPTRLTSKSNLLKIDPVNKNYLVPLALFVLALPLVSQRRVFTADDYARAEKFMTYNTPPLVLRSGVRATWLADERFWYRNTIAEGNEFILVDPVKKTRQPAFDHIKLAAALSTAASANYDAYHLPFTEFTMAADGGSISFTVGTARW